MIGYSIGKLTYQTIIPMDKFPLENTKTINKESIVEPGGNAAIVAALFGKWNMESYLVSVTGYDDFAETVKHKLTECGVRIPYVSINYEHKTTQSLVISSKETTSRTEIQIEPEIFHAKKGEYKETPNIIYSDGHEYSATVELFQRFSNEIRVLGASLNGIDPKEVESLAKLSQYVVFSLEYAKYITRMNVDLNNPTHLLNLYKELKNKFPNSINIVTLHNMGVLYSVGNEVKIMPTINNVKEVDRTGAGAIFDGTFCYCLGKGYDIEKCMRLSNIAGGLSTTKLGGVSSIQLLSDISSYYEGQFGKVDEVKEVVQTQPVANNANMVQPQMQTPPVQNNTIITNNTNVNNNNIQG